MKKIIRVVESESPDLLTAVSRSTQEPPNWLKHFGRGVRSFVPWLVFLGSAIIIWGWIANRTDWVVWGATEAPVQFNTALGLLLISIGLISRNKAPHGRLVRSIGLIVALLGLATLSQYVLRTSFGLDELLFTHTVTTATPFPGRMAPATAYAFILIGSAFLVNDSIKRAFGWAILILACLVLVGRLAISPSQLIPFTLMAPPTLILLLLIALWLLFLKPDESEPQSKQSDVVPIYVHTASICLLTVFMAFWQFLEQDQWQRRSQEVRVALETLSSDLEYRLQERGRALWRFADRWSRFDTLTREKWDVEAQRYLADFPNIDTILNVDPGFSVRWQASANPQLPLLEGTYLGTDQGRLETFLHALTQRRPKLMPLIDLRTGQRGTAYTVPIFDADRHIGYLNASLPATSLLVGIGGPLFDGFEIALLQNEQIEVGRLPTEDDLGALLLQKIPIGNGLVEGWKLALWPKNTYLKGQATQLPMLVLVFGLFSGLLTSVLFRINQRQNADRLLAQDAARIADERFKHVARATSDVIWDWNIFTDEVWWSDGTDAVFGYRRAEVDPTHEWQVKHIHPEDRERVALSLKRAIDGSASFWSDKYKVIKRDGQFTFVEDKGAVIRDKTGKAIRLIGSITDVSERVDLENRLRQAQKMESVGQLTGGIAHDFNNLLTVILGNTEVLADELRDKPRLQRLAEISVNAAERSAELTSRLLSFARKQPLNPKVVDVSQLILDMDGLLRRTLPEDVELEMVRSGGLWKIEVDATQLETAILNLALNARDAMPNGGHLTIEFNNVTLDDEYAADEPDVKAGQYVSIVVTDTGHGMPADVVSRVFEPFFTTKEVGKGSGLGLSMVYGFVKQSGGHVRVYSEPDEVTSFKLYFPRALALDEQTVSAPVAQLIPKGQETILVVEDEDLVREHVVVQLTSLGYQVLAAPNGVKALELININPEIALLFTDVVMPGGMGGRDLADAARLVRPDLKVLFTSGYTQNSMVHNGKLDEGVDLLGKPYRRDQLASKIRNALDTALK